MVKESKKESLWFRKLKKKLLLKSLKWRFN